MAGFDFKAHRVGVADELRRRAASAANPYDAMRYSAAARAVEPRWTHGVAPAILTGLGKLFSGAGRVAAGAADVAVSPATVAGPAATKAVGYLMDSPTLALPLAATIFAAPYFFHKAKDEHAKRLEEYNDMIQAPGRISIAEDMTLSKFFEKTAMRPPIIIMNAAGRAQSRPSFMDIGGEKLMEGAGKAVGEQLVNLGLSAIGGTVSSVFSSYGRRRLLENLLETDTVLADAVRRNPAMRETLVQAFGTMQRFAPSLTDDMNAVRSFLREVVLGGGHVNYAVIKHLVDTQKAISGR